MLCHQILTLGQSELSKFIFYMLTDVTNALINDRIARFLQFIRVSLSGLPSTSGKGGGGGQIPYSYQMNLSVNKLHFYFFREQRETH